MSHLERMFSFKKKSTPRYEALSKDETGFSEKAEGREKRSWMTLLPWILTGFFATTSLFLGVVVDSQCPNVSKGGSFASGFATDFITARKHIEVEQRTFTGGPAFDDKGKIYIPNPDPLLYVGDPVEHPEIDENWDRMTWGRYILITEEEARATWGDDIEDYWDSQRGGYVAGLDMFHTLHCLNNIRKAFRPDFYPMDHGSSKNPANRALHQDHCIEQIRQYIMCAGDMTPIPTKYFPSLGRNYVVSDVPHTCRNFEKLRDWMVDRYDGPSAVQPVFPGPGHVGAQ